MKDSAPRALSQEKPGVRLPAQLTALAAFCTAPSSSHSSTHVSFHSAPRFCLSSAPNTRNKTPQASNGRGRRPRGDLGICERENVAEIVMKRHRTATWKRPGGCGAQSGWKRASGLSATGPPPPPRGAARGEAAQQLGPSALPEPRSGVNPQAEPAGPQRLERA